MRLRFFLLSFGLFFITAESPAFAASLVQGKISTVTDTVHVEFSGMNKWNYESSRKVVDGHTIVEILVPPLSEDSVSELKNFHDPMVSEVKVDRKGADGRYLISIKLTAKSMESFDYLTDEPSRLIVDIFPPKTGDAKIQTADNQPVKKSNASVLVKKQKKVPASRAPATTDILKINNIVADNPLASGTTAKRNGIFDGADPDFERFQIKDYEIKEDSVLASGEKLYLELPVLRMPLEDLGKLTSHKPAYEIIPENNDENKQARLLLTLFTKGRFNVFNKTVAWFLEKYPKSKYDELVRFMWGDTYFQLWQQSHAPNDFELAMLRYRQAVEKYPNSDLIERTQLLMGFATFERGDFLGTVRMFEKQLRERPESVTRDRARFGISEAYMKIARYDEALAEYREIEKDGSTKDIKAEAAYRAGDVFMAKKEFTKAIAEYQAAAQKYPEDLGQFPDLLFNRASAEFSLKDYRKSLDTYGMFLRTFPSHEYAAYAMARVGEILEILGAPESRVQGAYLETYFRYGDAPAAIIARLHLLSSGMKGMKQQEVEKVVNDIQELAKKSDLQGIEQFSTVMIAQGLTSREEYDRVIDLLIKFYQSHSTGVDQKLISREIVENINKKINAQVNDGNYMEALKTHNQFADSWLKNSDRIDTRIAVAKAFEQAGAFSDAAAIFRDSLNRMLSLKGSEFEKQKAVVEKWVGEDPLFLRLASCQFKLNKFAEAYENLKNIKSPEKLSEKEQVERVTLAAALLEKRGELQSASRHLVDLIKEWTGQPQLMAQPYFQLANLEVELKKVPDAIKSLVRIDQLMQDSGAVPEEMHMHALERLGELQMDLGHDDEAAATWTRLLDLYETKRPLASIRYKVGKIYHAKGDMQKAADYWQPLKKNANSFWWNLAEEQLKNSEWSDSYKKYIQRIPAISERTNQ